MSATVPRAGVGPRAEDQTGNSRRARAGGGKTVGCEALGCSRVFVTTTASNRYCSDTCRRATEIDRVREAAQRLREANLIDGDRLEHLYVDLGLSVDQIASRVEAHPQTVVRFLRLHGIPVRERGRPCRAVADLFRRRRFDDEHNPPGLGLVEERIRAATDAIRHHDDEQQVRGVTRPLTYALRDALIDLASACLAQADQLPAPDRTLGDRL